VKPFTFIFTAFISRESLAWMWGFKMLLEFPAYHYVFLCEKMGYTKDLEVLLVYLDLD